TINALGPAIPHDGEAGSHRFARRNSCKTLLLASFSVELQPLLSLPVPFHFAFLRSSTSRPIWSPIRLALPPRHTTRTSSIPGDSPAVPPLPGGYPTTVPAWPRCTTVAAASRASW